MDKSDKIIVLLDEYLKQKFLYKFPYSADTPFLVELDKNRNRDYSIEIANRNPKIIQVYGLKGVIHSG